MAPFASRPLPCSFFCLRLCTRRARQHCIGLQDLHNAALAKPNTHSRVVPARVHDLHTQHNTHRRAARPQAAHKLNGSLHGSGRSCASNQGRTNTLPALPLRAARGEHGSGADMNARTKMFGILPLYNDSGSDSCSSDGNSTFLMPGSGNTRTLKQANSRGAKPGYLGLL
jgi:hypothetical protein